MKPMCAFKWQDYKSTLGPNFYVQPKLNGVRALYHRGQMQSRGLSNEEGKLWNTPVIAHLLEELNKLIPPFLLTDGELYLHGKSLQQINSAVAVKRLEPTALTTEIEYHIFDVINIQKLDSTFHERTIYLHNLKDRIIQLGIQKIKIVPTTFCDNQLAETLYAQYRADNYEGIMYRNAEAPYGFSERCSNKENRWKCLLKRKGWMDEEFEIIGFTRTTGEKGNKGFQLTCALANGLTFTVGSGLSHEMQDYYETNPPLNSWVKVRFEMYSDTGVPLKPTIEAILD